MASDWAQRRVLVTGATGLVGSWLCRRLVDEGAFVAALVRDWDPQSELIRSGTVQRLAVVHGCLEDFATVERAVVDTEADTVLHVGAQAIVGYALKSPLATFEANIRGTWHVLEACRLHADQVRRTVVASSDKAYGDVEALPYTEAMPAAGRHPYDVSKSCADLLAQTYAATWGLPVAVARCGNIYGGGDLNWSRIVPATILAAVQGRPVELRSDGTYTRDYLYVDDVVDAYLALAEASGRDGVRGRAFNFAPGRPSTVLEIVRAVLEAMGCAHLEPVILDRARAEIRHQFLDATLAREVLGWTPKWSQETALRATVAWYRTYLASFEAQARAASGRPGGGP